MGTPSPRGCRLASPLLPHASAVEVIESEPSFCLCVCVCVSTLTAKPFDLCVSQSITKKGLLGKRSVQFGKCGRYMTAQAFSFGLLSALRDTIATKTGIHCEHSDIFPVLTFHGFLLELYGVPNPYLSSGKQ